MEIIEKIRNALEAVEYRPVLARDAGADPSLIPLVVPFRPDEVGRELALFIQVLPHQDDDAVAVVKFSLLYPFPIEDDANVAEAIRTLFLLNRFLPIGSHAFCERTPAFHFQYSLVVRRDGLFPDSVIRETVDMIGFFTRDHGDYLRQVLAGETIADDLLSELSANGLDIPPIIESQAAADLESQ